ERHNTKQHGASCEVGVGGPPDSSNKIKLRETVRGQTRSRKIVKCAAVVRASLIYGSHVIDAALLYYQTEVKGYVECKVCPGQPVIRRVDGANRSLNPWIVGEGPINKSYIGYGCAGSCWITHRRKKAS